MEIEIISVAVYKEVLGFSVNANLIMLGKMESLYAKEDGETLFRTIFPS